MELKEIDGRLYEVVETGCAKTDCCLYGVYCEDCQLMDDKCYKIHNTDQYATKPIDWSQCDPLVAHFLRQGLALQYGGEQVMWQRDTTILTDKSAILAPGEVDFDKKTKKKIVKQKKELIQTLLDEGYLPNNDGHWLGEGPAFLSPMFGYCGKEPNCAIWKESWMEEVE